MIFMTLKSSFGSVQCLITWGRSQVSIQCSHINETLRSKAEEVQRPMVWYLSTLRAAPGKAIHILLDSILRHMLLRNDHLCNSFEMVPLGQGGFCDQNP